MRVGEASFGERELKLFLSFRRTCRAVLQNAACLEKCSHIPVTDFVRDASKRFKDVVTTLTTLMGGILVADADVAAAAADNGTVMYTCDSSFGWRTPWFEWYMMHVLSMVHLANS